MSTHTYSLFQAARLASVGFVRDVEHDAACPEWKAHEYAAQTGQNAGDGSILIPEQVVVDQVVPELGAMAWTQRLGARTTVGVRGRVVIPTVTSTPTLAHVDSEAMEAATPSATALGSLEPRPHLLVGCVRMTWGLSQQSQGAGQAIVSEIFRRQMAAQMDYWALQGTGTNGQPLGLAHLTGLNSVDFTSADFAGADQDVTDKLAAMLGALLTDGAQMADSRFAYLGEPAVFTKLATAKDADGQPLLFDRGPFDLRGLPAAWTPLARAVQGTDGTSAAQLFCGDFTRMRHVLWGDMTLRTEQVADDAKIGAVHVFAHVSHDVVIERKESFCRAAAFTASA